MSESMYKDGKVWKPASELAELEAEKMRLAESCSTYEVRARDAEAENKALLDHLRRYLPKMFAVDRAITVKRFPALTKGEL